ncbi:peritrophin-55-like [Lucilia sericata]|uniref:peritrophin-55-like n=1 Tax=Lucilia sericata TaxID=13632 RepID=UPI0018A810B6|nr:peritrophin-55-like [Lucilia sericata]
MKSVFVCALVLALAHHAFAGVCDSDVVYNSTLITPCLGNDVIVLWPNYSDFGTYYKCVEFGKPQLMKCPANTYFTYYFQQCTDCANFIPAPSCEYLAQTTDVKCVQVPTPTTAAPATTKPTTPKPTKPTTPKPTTPEDTTPEDTNPEDTTPKPTTPTPTTQKSTTPKPAKPTTQSPGLPTPPVSTGPSTPSDVPLPPIAPTPNTSFPTPPSVPPTPPSLGTPPPIAQPKEK